jgi:hypothetical protein
VEESNKGFSAGYEDVATYIKLTAIEEERVMDILLDDTLT